MSAVNQITVSEARIPINNNISLLLILLSIGWPHWRPSVGSISIFKVPLQ